MPGVYFYRCDLADTARVEEVCKEIKREHGDVSVLINNAGIGIGKTVLEVRCCVSLPLMRYRLTKLCPDDQCREREALPSQSPLASCSHP